MKGFMLTVVPPVLLFVAMWAVLGIYGVGSIVTIRHFYRVIPPSTYAMVFSDRAGNKRVLPVIPNGCSPTGDSVSGGTLRQEFECGPYTHRVRHNIVVEHYNDPTKAVLKVDGTTRRVGK